MLGRQVRLSSAAAACAAGVAASVALSKSLTPDALPTMLLWVGLALCLAFAVPVLGVQLSLLMADTLFYAVLSAGKGMVSMPLHLLLRTSSFLGE